MKIKNFSQPSSHNFVNNQLIRMCALSSFQSCKTELQNTERTDYYTVIAFDKGRARCHLDYENTIEAGKGQVLFIPLYHIVTFDFYEDCEGRVLFFGDAFFCKNNMRTSHLYQTRLFSSWNKTAFFSFFDRFNELDNLFKMIVRELERPYSKIQEQLLLNYVFSVLLLGEESYKPELPGTLPDTGHILVAEFKQLAHRELKRRQPLQFYAAKLNVSITTLENAFKKHEKTTPKKWLNLRAVAEIQKELKRTNRNVGEIAFKYGFSEVTNFTKFFKSHTGLTPSQFRTENL